jgi:hypothetical protein
MAAAAGMGETACGEMTEEISTDGVLRDGVVEVPRVDQIVSIIEWHRQW